MRALVFLVLLGACAEDTLQQALPDPPEDSEPTGWQNPFGHSPEFPGCPTGFHGRYYNLEPGHPDVEPAPDAPPTLPLEELDWWDDERFVFEKFDPVLDFGNGWWPVDGDFADDPAHFAVSWTGWIWSLEPATAQMILGAADDAWVIIDDVVVAELPGIKEFTPQVFTAELPGDHHRIEILFAHRGAGPSGFRFRVTSSDVAVCYPHFPHD